MPEALGEIGIVFTEEMRRTVRRKSYLLVVLSFPAILTLLMVAVPLIRAIVDDDDEPKPLGIVNLSTDLTLNIEGAAGLVTFPQRADGMEALFSDTIDELFVIAADYLDTGDVDWVHTGGGAVPGGASRSTIIDLLRTGLASDHLESDVLTRAMEPALFDRTRLDSDGNPIEEDEDAILGTVIVSMIAAGMLLFALMIGAGALIQSVTEEKESRMIEVLLTSIQPISLMTAKALASGSAWLAVILVWTGALMAIVPRIFDAIPDAPIFSAGPMLLVWVVSLFTAGYFLSAVILVGIGSLAARAKEANQIAMLVVMPNVAPFWAITSILPNPDGPLARTLSFIPFTAPVTMMIRIAVGEPAPWEIAGTLAIMVLTAIGLLWVSTRIFRAGLLMYGQRMSVARIFAALRQAG